MAKQRIVTFKKSKRPKHWYFVVSGKNHEKMYHSSPLKSRSWMYELIGEFEALGYIVKRIGV